MADFPRGGASALTPLEAQKIKDSAIQDVLFGKSTQKKQKKQKPKKNVKTESEEHIFEADKGPETANSLSYKNLTVGMKVLGCIREIQLTELVVSLPNSLTGHVPITSIHDVLTERLQKAFSNISVEDEDADADGSPTDLHELFHIGQFVPTVVKALDSNKHGYKKISLSMDPKDLNANYKSGNLIEDMLLWGVVHSIEDHGCIISFGDKDFTGFVPEQEKGNLKVGTAQWFIMKKVSGRVITVSAKEEEIKTVKIKDDAIMTFDTLFPGALVSAVITKVISTGVAVTFNGFQGFISTIHLPGHGTDAENKIKLKKKLLCRVIHLNSSSKVIGLSATNQLTSQASDLTAESLIGCIQKCFVLKANPRGLIVEFEDGQKGFVHISRVSDKKVAKIGKMYKTGSAHTCRIVGYNGMDGLFVASLQKSVIEQPFLRYVDIAPGMIVTGTIVTLEDFGMIVKLSDHIKGLCSRIHLADIILKHPEKKLTDGKKVTCRVLNVNAEKKRLKLTHKKTLVESELPIVTDYHSVSRGMQLHGYIDRIGDFGLIIRFYNGVKGMAPISHLGLQNNEKIDEMFYVGQVLKCCVLHCNPDKKKLKLSLKSEEELQELSWNLEPKQDSPNLFDILDVDVLEVKNDGINVQLPNGLKAFMKLEHLSDFKCNQEGLMFVYQASVEGKKAIKDLVYLGEHRKRLIVSRKGLLKFNARMKGFITDFDQLKVGTETVAVVHHIMPYGIFVELAPGMVGLAPNSNIADYFVSNPESMFYVGQTVLAKVLEIDQERKRFLVTLNPSQVKIGNSEDLRKAVTGPSLLKSLIEEREEILKEISKLPDGPVQQLPLILGNIVRAKVMSVRQEGIRVQTDSGSNGFIPDELRKGVDAETGDVIECVVIDINTKDWLFVATLIPEIIEAVKTVKKTKINPLMEVDVMVQRISPEYIVAAITSHAIPVSYIVAKEHLNDIRDVSKRFFVGQKLKATVQSITASGPILICEDSVIDGKPTLGSIVSANVKSIKAAQLNVSIRNTKVHGRIYISDIWDEIKEGTCPLDKFKTGESIRCKIIGFRDMKTSKYLPISHKQASKAFAELSCRPSIINNTTEMVSVEPKGLSDFKKGETVACYVKAVSETFMTVFVNQKVNGRISILHSSTDRKILKHFTSHFKHGAAYTATVLDVDEKNERLELSLVGNILEELKKNGKVCGRITKVLPRCGLLVELPGHKCGYAHITELYDEYKDNPLEDFKAKTFVKCCILSIKEDDHIDLSLRPSKASPEECQNVVVKDRSIVSMDNLHENDIVRGYIKSCSSFGVFVSLSPGIVGRVQIKNLSKYFVKNWKDLFPVGKLVKAKILSINPDTNQIELSLRGPDVKDRDPAPPPPKKRERTDSEQSETKIKRKRKDSDTLQIELHTDESDDDDDDLGLLHGDHSANDDSDEEEMVQTTKKSSKEELPRLSLPGGFDWKKSDEDDLKKRKHDSESESEDEGDKTGNAKKTKRQKRAEKKAEEEYLYQTELALLDKDRGPESAEDFDRLLLGSPNSSMLWIQYMAFYLHSAEIDKARAIAERALKTISFREESEKLNVWIASLNLECLYGSDESVQNIFNEAVKRNEPKKVYLKMTDIYIRNDKLEKAEKLFQTMTKRFNTSKKVWINYGFFLMKNGKIEAARKLLQRSFQSLPERKHINTILKFALMEFKFGEAEKGVTMFESVLKNHPKRTDIWSVYVDVLIKNNELEQARNTFEKIITLNLSTKKMKFIFKRYLEFEKKYGDVKSIEGVKTKAMEYVESRTGLN